MKEVTYEDWLKNPTPRPMWVWNEDEELKEKRKVSYILKDGVCMSPLLIVVNECIYKTFYETFRHCAEIEKQRRMTNKELSRWLKEKPTREFKYSRSIFCSVHSTYTYSKDDGDEEVSKNVVIREDDGEWREPLVEV